MSLIGKTGNLRLSRTRPVVPAQSIGTQVVWCDYRGACVVDFADGFGDAPRDHPDGSTGGGDAPRERPDGSTGGGPQLLP